MARHRARVVAPSDVLDVASLRAGLADGSLDWLSIATHDLGTIADDASDDRTRDQRIADFLRTLAQSDSVTHACDVAGISRDTAYRWRAEDPRFAALWEVAKQRTRDTLEASIYQRALAGDTLLSMFVMKQKDNSYRDSYRPEPAGHAGTAAAEPASVGAWRDLLEALSLSGSAADLPALGE